MDKREVGEDSKDRKSATCFSVGTVNAAERLGNDPPYRTCRAEADKVRRALSDGLENIGGEIMDMICVWNVALMSYALANGDGVIVSQASAKVYHDAPSV